jgi:hypothetical protein
VKIGLVLAAGGSKGAYQVGVYRFLSEFLTKLQIDRFHCIAGTSIGALNAFLFATTKPCEALATWKKMANPLGVSSQKRALILAYGTLALFTLIPPIAFTCSVLIYVLLHHRLLTLGVAGLFLALSIVSTYYIIFDLDETLIFFPEVASAVAMEIGVAIFVLFVLGSAFSVWPFGREPTFDLFGLSLLQILTNALIWALLFAIAHRCWAPIEKRRQAVIQFTRETGYYDQSRLKAFLREHVSIPLQCWRADIVIGTVSYMLSYWDPYLVSQGSSLNLQQGKLVREWLPDYIDLCSIDSEKRLETLINSSAIPALFPNVVRGRHVSDGVSQINFRSFQYYLKAAM